MIDVWQYSEYALDSEYATFLNMLGSDKVVNKIFHYKYLTRFWICLEFWKYQVTQVSVENSPPYMFERFLSSSWALSLPGLECTRVLNMPRLHMVLRKLYVKDSKYFECLEFWICEGFECIRSLNMLYLRVLSILHRIYLTKFWIYHGFKICQSSEFVRFHYENTTSYRCLTGYWLFLRFCIYQGSKHTTVTQCS